LHFKRTNLNFTGGTSRGGRGECLKLKYCIELMENVDIEFTKKNECLKYCESNNLQFFQRDINVSCAKLFLATTYKNIWQNIQSRGVLKANYYESWSSTQPVKLFIDYDKKMETVDQDMGDANHKSDILNIINTIKNLIPGITKVSILKSIPDTTKKSYHIIFSGIHFNKIKTLDTFIEDQLKPNFKELFDKKIVDTSIYKPICFRSLLCTKHSQTRALYLLETEPFLTELQEIPKTPEETTFENFLDTCITHIEETSSLYHYKTEKKKDTFKRLNVENEDIFTDREVIKKYLDILDPVRYTDRPKWLNIGYILKSINPDYNDLFHYFSSRWEHYNTAEVNTTWDSLNSEYIYTIENLKYLAKIDNPDDYTEITKDIPNHDIKYLRPFDNILSKLIHRLYGDRFVCSDCERNVWYYFNGTRWKLENKSYNLRVLIINEVFNKIENYRRQLVKEGSSDELIRNYYNILQKLGSGIKLNCLELEFYNSNFDKIIDQNKDLLGFENGVFDLAENVFRLGRSSDYVCMSTGYDYVEYTPDSPEYMELYELICKILPDHDTREFTLKSLATCLDGHNRDENFYIWSGKANTGGNGKSTLCDLLLKALGEYACISPVSLITGKRESANSANSALANIRNKRAVIMQEPAATDVIQSDIIKSFTGNDKISTRENYGNQIEFKPCAKFFMACNKLPNVSEMDGGVTRRLKLTEFTSRFVENPDPENLKRGIHEFKIDKELKTKLEHRGPVFINLLIHYYRKYREEGLVPPEAVVAVTKKYEANNNIIKQFIDETVVTGTNKDFIVKDDLKTIFNRDYILKSHFGKFSNFISQLETALFSEFRLDEKRKIVKLQGFYIRREGDDDDTAADLDPECDDDL